MLMLNQRGEGLATNVYAQGGPPSLPARFFGEVTIDGSAAPVGTLITAVISGTVSVSTTTTIQGGTAVYVIDVPGDNPGTPEIDGGRDGSVVYFTIGRVAASQTGTWLFGGLLALDISAISITPVTVTPIVTPTPMLSTVTPTPPKPTTPVPIPEPVTVVLFGIGLTGLATLQARRRR